MTRSKTVSVPNANVRYRRRSATTVHNIIILYVLLLMRPRPGPLVFAITAQIAIPNNNNNNIIHFIFYHDIRTGHIIVIVRCIDFYSGENSYNNITYYTLYSYKEYNIGIGTTINAVVW